MKIFSKKLFFANLRNTLFTTNFIYLMITTPAGIYLLKFNNRNTRIRCKTCSQLTIKLWTYCTPCYSISIVNLEQVNAGWDVALRNIASEIGDLFRLVTSRHLPVQSQQWKQDRNVWNLFRVNNKDSGTTSDVVLLSVWLTLNGFHTFSWCVHNWL